MEVICKCGGKTRERSHKVTTEKGAEQWGVDVVPITVEQSECSSCGRYMVKVFDTEGSLILSRG